MVINRIVRSIRVIIEVWYGLFINADRPIVPPLPNPLPPFGGEGIKNSLSLRERVGERGCIHFKDFNLSHI
jgi:hypothetical protein